MPHTNRKKKGPDTSTTNNVHTSKPIIHIKRQLLLDDEGWTHVVDSKRPPPSDTTNTTTKPFSSKSDSLRSANVISGQTGITAMDLPEIQSEHTRYTQKWQNSEACGILREKILAVVQQAKDMGRPIDNIVCIGSGSFQDWVLAARKRHHVQLAALQSIVEFAFSGENGRDGKKFAQEIAFTQLDREFLSSLGYEVVDDPAAWEKITERSLVFGIHLYPAQYASILSQKRPVVVIGNDVLPYEGRDWNQTEGEDGIRKLRNDYTSTAFPQLRGTTYFSDTVIYVLKGEE